MCLELALSLSFSKRGQGPTGLAPTKALKTGPASAAGAATRHAGLLASAQGALQRGAQAARVAMGQASQADPPIGAAIMPGEAADAVTAPSPPDLLPAPTSTPAGAVTDSLAGLPVAADVEMVEAPPPMVIPDLPVLGHEERAVIVAEVGDRRPVALAEKRPSTSMVVVPDVSTAGGPNAAVERHAEPWPTLGSSGLTPAQLNPNEWCGQPLWFWSRDTLGPSSPSTMSWRRSLGIVSVSIPRRR
jgi:hypothetical protein